MGSAPSSIGTPKLWYVNAFTQGNDLPWNAQTLLACQCASGACPGAHGSQENTSSIASCGAHVNVLCAVSMRKTRTTFHLEDADKEAIAAIREHYGLSSNDDAIRLALREWYRHIKGGPTASPLAMRNGLISPWLKPGVLRAGLIKRKLLFVKPFCTHMDLFS